MNQILSTNTIIKHTNKKSRRKREAERYTNDPAAQRITKPMRRGDGCCGTQRVCYTRNESI